MSKLPTATEMGFISPLTIRVWDKMRSNFGTAKTVSIEWLMEVYGVGWNSAHYHPSSYIGGRFSHINKSLKRRGLPFRLASAGRCVYHIVRL